MTEVIQIDGPRWRVEFIQAISDIYSIEEKYFPVPDDEEEQVEEEKDVRARLEKNEWRKSIYDWIHRNGILKEGPPLNFSELYFKAFQAESEEDLQTFLAETSESKFPIIKRTVKTLYLNKQIADVARMMLRNPLDRDTVKVESKGDNLTITEKMGNETYIWEMDRIPINDKKTFSSFGPKLFDTLAIAVKCSMEQDTPAPRIPYAETMDLFEGDSLGAHYERVRNLHDILDRARFIYINSKGEEYSFKPYLRMKTVRNKGGYIQPFLDTSWTADLVHYYDTGERPEKYLRYPTNLIGTHSSDPVAKKLQVFFLNLQGCKSYPMRGGTLLSNFLINQMEFTEKNIETLFKKGPAELIERIERPWESLKGECIQGWTWIPPKKLSDFLNDSKSGIMGFHGNEIEAGGPAAWIRAEKKFKMGVDKKIKGKFPPIPKVTAKNILQWKIRFLIKEDKQESLGI
jgi:hypothetical protein